MIKIASDTVLQPLAVSFIKCYLNALLLYWQFLQHMVEATLHANILLLHQQSTFDITPKIW